MKNFAKWFLKQEGGVRELVHLQNLAYGQHLYVCYSGVPIIYHESESLPWGMSIHRVHVLTMSPYLYHKSMSKP